MEMLTDMPPGAWVAYTDGAAQGNPGPGGAGVVLYHPATHGGARPATLVAWALGESTNKTAELMAVWLAITTWARLGGQGKVVVNTDSRAGWRATARGPRHTC